LNDIRVDEREAAQVYHTAKTDDRCKVSNTEQHRRKRFRHVAERVDLCDAQLAGMVGPALSSPLWRCLLQFRLKPADSRLERSLLTRDG